MAGQVVVGCQPVQPVGLIRRIEINDWLIVRLVRKMPGLLNFDEVQQERVTYY